MNEEQFMDYYTATSSTSERRLSEGEGLER